MGSTDRPRPNLGVTMNYPPLLGVDITKVRKPTVTTIIAGSGIESWQVVTHGVESVEGDRDRVQRTDPRSRWPRRVRTGHIYPQPRRRSSAPLHHHPTSVASSIARTHTRSSHTINSMWYIQLLGLRNRARAARYQEPGGWRGGYWAAP